MTAMRQTRTDLLTALSRSLLPEYRLMSLAVADCPVFLAIACPEADGVTGLKHRLPAGRGLSQAEALITAAAEAVELRASLAGSHLSDLRRAPRREGVAQVAARDLVTGAARTVPAQAVFLDGAALLSESLRQDADSTGCAAGPTMEAAAFAALCECVERDALALWWHGGQGAPTVPTALIDERHPRLSWWLDNRARRTRLYDLTTDLGVPVVAAVSADAAGRSVALGCAARPRVAEAALSAVTEMVQSEIGMDQARQAGDPEVARWDAQADWSVQPQFAATGSSPLRDAPDGLATCAGLAAHLAALGHAPLAVTLTLPGDPLESLRVLVPGLCAMRGRVETDRFHKLRPGATPCFPEPY